MARDESKKAADIDVKAVEETIERLRGQIQAADYARLRQLLESFLWVARLVHDGRTTIRRLRRMLRWSSSEKTADVLGQPQKEREAEEDRPDPDDDGGGSAPQSPASSESATASSSKESKPGGGERQQRAKGHGRRGAADYTEAENIAVSHECLRPGDRCPLCARGTLYELHEPARVVRILGQAPLRAVSWNCQRLRCSACGAVHTARAPAEAQGGKFAESAVSMMAVLRFGTGVPHHRLDQLQQNLGTPVPASTQWEMLERAAKDLEPVHEELIRQAAQARLIHNDDTHGRVLGLMGKRRAALVAGDRLDDPERTGLFTTALLAVTEIGHQIAVFFTGRKHSGENLASVLKGRAEELAPPIQMSDALAGNHPPGQSVIHGYCLAHARRHFVDQVENFPEQCAHVLGQIGKVYGVDEECRKQCLSDEERLREHQRRSAPIMNKLHSWMISQLDEKQVEPNSGLGKAFEYMLKRWDGFILFLRLPGVPLDNNVCERALKMAIRHRKNSLFYRTERGAEIGDMYMSLIHTARLCGENAFEYLSAMLTHTREVAERPGDWMPWNWREATSASRLAA